MADAPRVDWRFAALCAAILDVLFTIQFWVTQDNLTLRIAFARQTVTWAVWLALAPFVIAAARKHPFVDAVSRGRWLMRQLVTGGWFAILHSIIAATLRFVLGVAYFSNIFEAIVSSFFLAL